MKRILICGGRDVGILDAEQERIHAALAKLEQKHGYCLEVIHGACPTGIDAIADTWATWGGYLQHRYHADWDTHGKAAGPIRNELMITEGKPDGAVVFPGGRGTADMTRHLLAYSIPIWMPFPEESMRRLRAIKRTAS